MAAAKATGGAPAAITTWMAARRPLDQRRVVGASTLTDADGGLTEALESAVEATDVCYSGTDQASEACSPIWDEVWCTQQLEGASETYATCTTSAATSWDHPTGTQGEGPSPPTTDDETDDRAARELAQRLRRRFEESAKWRAGAGERRAAAAAAARSRRTFAANGMIGRAAASFGFDAEELNDSDSLLRKVKERWRELAKQEHPDVKGGNSDRFLELKASYQALLRVARSGAESDAGCCAKRTPNEKPRRERWERESDERFLVLGLYGASQYAQENNVGTETLISAVACFRSLPYTRLT